MRRQYQETITKLPALNKIAGARKHISTYNKNIKTIVLDDDPTGCQTVHDVHVLMQWDEDTLAEACKKYNNFYILHNTRARAAAEAEALNRTIASRLLKYIPRERLRLISRSDSTLRGHFLPEISALSDTTGPYDGIVVVPYFKEGGRFTIADEHYVKIEDQLVPAAQTEYADDAVFGFSNSNLPAWISEKTNGHVDAAEVLTITLEDIRIGGLSQVTAKLTACANNKYVIVNAVEDEDLEVVVLGIQQAEKEGKRFLYRSAASLVKVLLGQEDIPLWQPKTPAKKGVIIAGSHVQKTTDQLKALTATHALASLELSIKSILYQPDYDELCARSLNKILDTNQTALIYTERTYRLQGDEQARLQAMKKISDFLSALIHQLPVQPDFVIAKGGITSNDIAKNGLDIVDARVLGQIQPGIPVWLPGPESRFHGCTYVVFPGNVGATDTLKKVYETLCGL